MNLLAAKRSGGDVELYVRSVEAWRHADVLEVLQVLGDASVPPVAIGRIQALIDHDPPSRPDRPFMVILDVQGRVVEWWSAEKSTWPGICRSLMARRGAGPASGGAQ